MTHKDALEILGLEADASLDEAKRYNGPQYSGHELSKI